MNFIAMVVIHILCLTLLVNHIEMLPQDLVTPPFVAVTKSPLRVKRTAIGTAWCPEGYARLWYRGPCVTCDEYMDKKDTAECPF